jgi:hypothetical protein
MIAATLSSLLVALPGSGTPVLLCPDSLRQTVWAFDATTGAIVSQNVIVDTQYLDQPIQVVSSPTGTMIVTDEVDATVREFSAQGVFIRELCGPAQGLTRAYGCCVKNGKIYVTEPFVTTLSEPGRIWRMNLDGSDFELFLQDPLMRNPRGILPVPGGFMVADSGEASIGGEDLEFVSDAGVVQSPPFFDSEGVSYFDFPQQIAPAIGGGFWVAGFTAPSGLWLVSVNGTIDNYYPTFTSARGVWPLGNGQLLYTGGTRVQMINPNGGDEVEIVNNPGGAGNPPVSSFRFLTPFTLPPACPADLDGDGLVDGADLGGLLSGWGAPGAADIDGSGAVDGSDLGIMLSAWGPCS